jgi:hypothetical protein
MPHQIQIRRAHPYLGAAIRRADRVFFVVRRAIADRVDLAHRWVRRLGNRLENPGAPLNERGDWYRFGPMDMTPERRAAIDSLAKQRPNATR